MLMESSTQEVIVPDVMASVPKLTMQILEVVSVVESKSTVMETENELEGSTFNAVVPTTKLDKDKRKLTVEES